MQKDRKQIPFRYGAADERNLKTLYKLQYGTTKTNEALCDALEIAADLIKEFEKDNPGLDHWDFGYKFKVWIKEKISKS